MLIVSDAVIGVNFMLFGRLIVNAPIFFWWFEVHKTVHRRNYLVPPYGSYSIGSFCLVAKPRLNGDFALVIANNYLQEGYLGHE